MNTKDKRKTIQGAKEWVEHNLPVALQLRNDSYSKILILLTIDAFAQMWGNYPPSCKNNETFCNFIQRYSSQSLLFSQICPVTLQNHYCPNEQIKLKQGEIYSWDDPILAEEANRISLKIYDEKQREKAKGQHTYIKLLYQLRNKVVHELNNLGTKIEFREDIPTIVSGYDEHHKLIWTLNYPRQWLYNLAQETIFGFIDDCLKAEELLRFLDNERTIDLTWYI